MITPFTIAEGAILVKLLIAHCLSDFVLQSSKGIKNKELKIFRSSSLYWHTAITALMVCIVLWNNSSRWIIAAVIAGTHFIIDAGKLYANRHISESRFPQKDIWLFVVDQLLHLVVTLCLWLWMIAGFKRMAIVVEAAQAQYNWLLMLFGYLLITGPVTYLIRFLTRRWSGTLDTTEGLQDAGKWIGILERILILTLVFVDQFTAIGFLVAAKSILRLIDKPEVIAPSVMPNQRPAFNSRKHTEYVLIGTFLSFGFAILTGLMIRLLMTN